MPPLARFFQALTPGRRVALVAGAAALAHLGCLWATFYMDDFVQIVDSDAVDHARILPTRLRVLTYATYWLTWRMAGMSALAFHAGNLLIHAAAALTVLGFARDFLIDAARLPGRRAARIALGAGLLFAVHPLCSEIPNYVRARDIALVGEFSLLAGWAVLRWRREGRARWLAAAAGAGVVAAFCKEVGCVVAGTTVAFVWFATRRPATLDPRAGHPPRRWWAGLAALAAAGLGVFWYVGGLDLLGRTAAHSLGDPRLGWYVLTQARIFWQYAARVFLPLRLCSDHQVAWTFSAADAVAWAALVALGATVLATARTLVRGGPGSAGRAAAALGAIALVDLLHRLGNVSGELMVEYRVYPSMMAVCVLLAWGWDRLAVLLPAGRGRRAAAWTGIALLAAGAVLSERRTLDWRSADTLAANITAQYPLQARAAGSAGGRPARAPLAGRARPAAGHPPRARRDGGVQPVTDDAPLRRVADDADAGEQRGQRSGGARPAGPRAGGARATGVAARSHGNQPRDGPDVLGAVLLRERHGPRRRRGKSRGGHGPAGRDGTRAVFRFCQPRAPADRGKVRMPRFWTAAAGGCPGSFPAGKMRGFPHGTAEDGRFKSRVTGGAALPFPPVAA